MSLTPDIAVNHKYIMISYAFVAMFWGWAVVQLFGRGIWQKSGGSAACSLSDDHRNL